MRRVMRTPPPEVREQMPYTTWYEPHDQQEAIDHAVWFVLSQPAVTTIASSGDVRILARVLDAARRFHTLTDAEQEALVAVTDPAHTIFA